jgi:hypothetical protein
MVKFWLFDWCTYTVHMSGFTPKTRGISFEAYGTLILYLDFLTGRRSKLRTGTLFNFHAKDGAVNRVTCGTLILYLDFLF